NKNSRTDHAQAVAKCEANAIFVRRESALQPVIEHAIDFMKTVAPGSVVGERTPDDGADFAFVRSCRPTHGIMRGQNYLEVWKLVQIPSETDPLNKLHSCGGEITMGLCAPATGVS